MTIIFYHADTIDDARSKLNVTLQETRVRDIPHRLGYPETARMDLRATIDTKRGLGSRYIKLEWGILDRKSDYDLVCGVIELEPEVRYDIYRDLVDTVRRAVVETVPELREKLQFSVEEPEAAEVFPTDFNEVSLALLPDEFALLINSLQDSSVFDDEQMEDYFLALDVSGEEATIRARALELTKLRDEITSQFATAAGDQEIIAQLRNMRVIMEESVAGLRARCNAAVRYKGELLELRNLLRAQQEAEGRRTVLMRLHKVTDEEVLSDLEDDGVAASDAEMHDTHAATQDKIDVLIEMDVLRSHTPAAFRRRDIWSQRVAEVVRTPLRLIS